MVKTNYQAKIGKESKTAKATLKNANVSLKNSTEMMREIKGQPLDKAIKRIHRIAEKTEALPLRRYNRKVAHRKGDAKSGVKSGRYPLKVAKKFIEWSLTSCYVKVCLGYRLWFAVFIILY